MRMTEEEFESLPEDVQQRALDHLRAFDECLIVFENGRFVVGGGSCLATTCAPDHKVHGCVYADDMYTPEQRIENFIEVFHDYPPQYKGRRDYAMLHLMDDMRRNGVEAKIHLVYGNAELPVDERVCRRCKSPVWKSEVGGYSYQCFECDEDLYEFETEVPDGYSS